MKILSSLKKGLKFAAVATAIIATTSLTNCGGGSGGGGSTTVRPKTLDDVTLTMSGGNATFEFIRGSASGRAIDSNDIETGTFVFSSTSTRAPYRSVENGFVDVIWPRTVGVTAYTYRALNDTSGELTLAVGTDTQWNIITGGTIGTFTPDYSYFDGRIVSGAAGPSSLVMLVSFDGSSTAGIRLDDPDNPTAGTGSSSTFTTGSFTVGGQPLPANYNPTNSSTTQVSEFSLPEITGTNIEFVDTASTANSFSLLPTSTATTVSGEVGQTIYRDNAGTALGGAADYSYALDAGTDNATMILSGGTPVDGTITLTYTSAASNSDGSQIQQAGGSYTTSSGRSGTFAVSQQGTTAPLR